MTPFVPISSIVWRMQEGAAEPENVSATFQSYSYLYTALLNWFARNSEFLASPRSTELLGFLSKCTRLSADHGSHGRTLMHELGLSVNGESDYDVPSLRMRVHAFAKTEQALRTLASKTLASEQSEATGTRLQNEWMGLAERSRIIQEAFELLFATSEEHQELERHCNDDASKAQQCRRGAAALIGWFYAFLSDSNNGNVSAKSITTMALELASSLPVADLPVGSVWLQQKRTEFQILTQLRIKIAWFWLLKCCFTSVDSIQNDAAVVDALESLEYAFRRFAPAKSKRCVL